MDYTFIFKNTRFFEKENLQWTFKPGFHLKWNEQRKDFKEAITIIKSEKTRGYDPKITIFFEGEEYDDDDDDDDYK